MNKPQFQNQSIPKANNSNPSNNPYSDIMNLPRPKCPSPMPLHLRAAQFSPYAALIGHKDIIAENETLAAEKIDIDHEITLESTDDESQLFPDYSVPD